MTIPTRLLLLTLALIGSLAGVKSLAVVAIVPMLFITSLELVRFWAEGK